MRSASYDPPVAGTTIDAGEHRRLTLEMAESRKFLIATLRALPLDCREHVLNGETAGGHFIPHECLELFFERLREFHSGHDDPDVSHFLERARRSRSRMNRAREALILANLGIVPHVVRGFYRGTIPLRDLIQDGYIGLLKAVDRFDPDRGAMFSTYACWWIHRALNDAFAYHARLIRLPDCVRLELRRLREVTRELEHELDRLPLDEEIARRSGLSIRKIKKLRLVPPDPSALEDIAEDRNDGWHAVIAGSGTPDPFEATLKSELREQATLALEQLNPRERHIIKLRFGFQKGDGMTLKQIGDTIGVSRERVRQIQSVAMDKLSRWAKRTHIANC
jgi:RNA polymerase primary sigma factor